MAIQREVLSDGSERFVVRVKRYGKRRVLGRFINPWAAIHVETEQYRLYLVRRWIDGKDPSTCDE